MVTIRHKYYHGSVFQEKTGNKIDTAMEQKLQNLPFYMFVALE